MGFETKIIDIIHCPRCNGKAEQRIDIRNTDNDFVLVYTVCPVCKLNAYSHFLTKKEVSIQAKIKRLEDRADKNPKLAARIQKRIQYLRNLV